MKVEWATVLSVIVALLIILAAKAFFTKQSVDPKTGEIKNSFSGFSGN